MSAEKDYWLECMSLAAEECELELSELQLNCLADAAESGHEHYGMAFYSPPASDFYSQKEREWEAKYKALQQEFDKYQNNAETAVKVALRQHRDTNVSIGEHGEVRRHDGRSDRIQ
ncbi:hypothetical protein D7U98_09630 [Stenotrophomonas maltophilia]|uniref:hypothetical protein n=1 Tax=Stenotrophomonas maltophilia TaxID=40324 RepID=UPI001310F4AA|nr:hypothetical protein [Stenotrophomonas maltophilia]MBA0395658.1 hypothetical protein [Stenotrophomonas maltophilia]